MRVLKRNHIFFPRAAAFAFAFAAIALPALAAAQGLVPCGREGQEECGFRHIIILADTVIDFLMFNIAMPLAAASFAFAGFKFVAARGNTSQIEEARSIFGSVLTGFLIIASAWFVISLITSLLGEEYTFLGFAGLLV